LKEDDLIKPLKNKWVQLVLLFFFMLFIGGLYFKGIIEKAVSEVYYQGFDDCRAFYLMYGYIPVTDPVNNPYSWQKEGEAKDPQQDFTINLSEICNCS
jgi:hypothetical protein